MLLSLLICLVQFYSQLQNPSAKSDVAHSVSSIVAFKQPATAAFLGDEACRSCHRQKITTYHKTAHYLTSQMAEKNSVVGTFNDGANVLKTSNPNLFFRMDSNQKGLFETAMWGTPPKTWSRTERLDLVIGSGGKGQSYLFWDEDELFELPVGYSSVLRQWINNPGYKDGSANFERRVIPRCLECHATYFKAIETIPSGNRYDRTDFVLGISCERCHGPGREHVARVGSHPVAGSDLAIVNPAKLSQARQFEVCSQCHGGQGVRELVPAFSYVPGQSLANYIDLGPVDSNAVPEVHGTQIVLLEKSRCFQASSNMSCATCHDVHQPESDLTKFSEKCLSCHKAEKCGEYQKVGANIASNCIDCHMPNQESKVLFVDVQGKRVSPKIRSHWIKVYPGTPTHSQIN